ncbi:hypothetical protein MMC16_001770 [Acarospora aff. strigata]|nr:hypothetical protein [Acarospora aff. strigata]
MASLAFINPKGAYISQVSFCYLHIRPYWYRIALSWVPRYLIFCTIIIVYVTVYAYVKLQFSGFKGDYKQAHQENDAWLGDGKKHQDETYDLVHREPLRGPADEPKLISHGLLASSGEVSSATLGSRETSEGSSTHPGSEVVTTSSIRIPKPVVARVQPSWEALTFNTVPSSLMTVEEEPPPRSSSTTDSDEDSASITPDFRSAIQPSHHSSRGKMSIIQALNVQPPPTLHIRDRMHTSGDQELSTESANGAFLDGSGPDFNGEQLRKRRKQSLYQVGFLFLYPLVYILMWIVPFVNHCLLYSDDYIQHPSFGLTCAQIVSVILQCAVDCLVFSAREAPWKHIPGSRRTFWDSFLFWTHDLSRENQLWGGNPLHLSSLAGSLSPSLRAPTSSTAQWAGHHLRPGDLQTEMALQARGRFLRSQSDRRRRLVFMRRKLGTKKEKLWWEVEGAWKNDSGLLGEEVARERRRLGLDESSGDEGDTDEEIV